jgi:hypothetical protein
MEPKFKLGECFYYIERNHNGSFEVARVAIRSIHMIDRVIIYDFYAASRLLKNREDEIEINKNFFKDKSLLLLEINTLIDSLK